MKSGTLDADMYLGSTSSEAEGRDQGNASTHQGTPKIATRPPEAREEAWD